MNQDTPLCLHEEVLLLALRDEEGTTVSGAFYPQAIGGALLAELMLRRRIGVEEARRKKLARVLDPTRIGQPLLDECLEKIRAARKSRTLENWVAEFAGTKHLKERVAEPLCDRGILREAHGKILGLFPRTTYPAADPKPEAELVERLRKAIFGESRDVDPRTVVLISLADAAHLLAPNFDRKELKERRDRIRKIVAGEVTGEAAKEAIEAMQAAVMMLCVLPAITVTTTH
jgi:hypothetical protein